MTMITARVRRPLTMVAATATAATAALTLAAPAQAASCYARNGDLYCGNVYNASIKQVPAYDRNGVPVATVDYLRTTFSYFDCWTRGQRHSGGNDVWYRTYGDVTGRWGYVAAAAVYTPTDPFPGVARC
jgi:hypothetical protein